MAEIGVNIALIEENRILLTRREDFDVWCLPGGSLKSGESITDAAIREMYEETGIIVQLKRIIGIFYQNPNQHNILFAAHHIGGELRANDAEVTEVAFFSEFELPSDIMWWYRLRITRAFIGAVGEIWYQDVSNLLHSLKREEVYKLRDSEGLTRKDFYYRYLNKVGPLGEKRLL